MSKCYFCPETRALQKAHLIPKFLTKRVDNIDNDFTLLMCPSHHWYYDNDRLNRAEAEKIKPLITQALNDLVQFSKIIRPVDGRLKEHRMVVASLQKKIADWMNRKREAYNV